MSQVFLCLYAIRHQNGKYLSSKLLSRRGSPWVDTLDEARIFPKASTPRQLITAYANQHPKDGIPELVELRVTEVCNWPEAQRVRKAMDRKAKQEAERRERHAQWERNMAESKMAEAKATLDRLNKA